MNSDAKRDDSVTPIDGAPGHFWLRSPCPKCGALLDASTPTGGGRAPTEGDIGVCLYCQGVHRFGDNMRRVAMTPEMIASLDEDVRSAIGSTIAAMAIARSMMPRQG